MRAVRFDLATASAFTIARGSKPGALALDATPAIAKVLPHSTGDELLPPEELFDPRALRSFDGAIVTLGHPKLLETRADAQELGIGYVRSDARRDGDRVRVTLVITDPTTERAILDGELVELSVGWFVKEDRTPGVYQGSRYTLVRRDVRVNHVGIGPRGWGRAGAEARLR